MEYHLSTKLNGNIAMTSCFHENSFLQRDGSLYKFIWVRHGTLDVEVDHVVMHLEKEEMISLTPLHHVQIRGVDGEYLTFLFNSNFYCIYRHDSEVETLRKQYKEKISDYRNWDRPYARPSGSGPATSRISSAVWRRRK